MGYTLFLNTCFLVICSFMIVHFHTPDVMSLESLGDYKAKCLYLKSNDPCACQGYIDYLYLFYCKFGKFPSLGYTLLFLWLLLLRLSPTIAGVTLLSLGNGAPDVFSSLVSFQESGTRDMGFNTVLGGVSFVSCVVVGSVSIAIRQSGVQVAKSAFVRDVYFLLFVVLALFAIGFTLIYVVYVVIVYASFTRWKEGGDDDERGGIGISDCDNDLSLSVPLLNGAQEYDLNIEKDYCCMRYSIHILTMSLYLPRRLTIPVVCEERWSKVYAVSSVLLAPNLIVYGIGILVGTILGVIAFFTTKMSGSPEKCLFPWLAGGFVMSVTWSYIIAQELVGLLFLAWGNSLGDLVTNLTMALNGGPEGAQVAMSCCYAGSIFDTLTGLGLSLVTYPYLWETMVFLVAGLVWALVVLRKTDMKLDGLLGGGLLFVYFLSLFIRLIQTKGSLQ
ncbi:hypothetical protein AAZX31_04G192300 [Glycine max]